MMQWVFQIIIFITFMCGISTEDFIKTECNIDSQKRYMLYEIKKNISSSFNVTGFKQEFCQIKKGNYCLKPFLVKSQNCLHNGSDIFKKNSLITCLLLDPMSRKYVVRGALQLRNSSNVVNSTDVNVYSDETVITFDTPCFCHWETFFPIIDLKLQGKTLFISFKFNVAVPTELFLRGELFLVSSNKHTQICHKYFDESKYFDEDVVNGDCEDIKLSSCTNYKLKIEMNAGSVCTNPNSMKLTDVPEIEHKQLNEVVDSISCNFADGMFNGEWAHSPKQNENISYKYFLRDDKMSSLKTGETFNRLIQVDRSKFDSASFDLGVQVCNDCLCGKIVFKSCKKKADPNNKLLEILLPVSITLFIICFVGFVIWLRCMKRNNKPSEIEEVAPVHIYEEIQDRRVPETNFDQLNISYDNTDDMILNDIHL